MSPPDKPLVWLHGDVRIDADAIVILDVYQKKTTRTPQRVIDACRQRLRDYDTV